MVSISYLINSVDHNRVLWAEERRWRHPDHDSVNLELNRFALSSHQTLPLWYRAGFRPGYLRSLA